MECLYIMFLDEYYFNIIIHCLNLNCTYEVYIVLLQCKLGTINPTQHIHHTRIIQ